jgi:hypothetical protein
VLGIAVGSIGTWFLFAEEVIIDGCGGGIIRDGIQQGTTACKTVYGISPWIWLFVAILAISIMGLTMNLITKSSRNVL